MKIRQLLFFFLLIVVSVNLFGQLPGDLSKVKASQISDDQLIQLVEQAKISGQGEQEILQALKQRGLPDTEIQAILGRLSSMNSSFSTSSYKNNLDLTSSKRTLEKKLDIPLQQEKSSSKIFGAELFGSISPIFAPNLNIATPLNYRVGSGDELLLEVFGSNVFSQKLTVSREGFINVRYAGLVNVNGLTIEDVSAIVKRRLSKFIPALSSGATKLQLSLGNIRSITISVVGAVNKPGSITLPSLATLFNALYATGGPLENGSFRRIELIRGNKKILEADLYQYLTKGDQAANVFLQDNDLIRVPFAGNLVQITGLLNREGVFEILPKESLTDLLEFAGGFKPDAYKARVTGTRNGNLKREIIDVSIDNFNLFSLQHGDSLHVSKLVELYSNRVTIDGAVYKPGVYTWQKGQQLSELIDKAAGLKADAFLGQVNILRTYDNLEKENISLDLRPILKGLERFELKNEDQVTVYSSYKLKDEFNVYIAGEVRTPGAYLYSDSLTLQQLILQAGGFTDRSVPTGIEVSRKKRGNDPSDTNQITSEIISVSVNPDLTKVGKEFLLCPSDIIFIKSDPSKLPQQKVIVKGQVLYPGTYILQNRQERLSSVLLRAGGFLPKADVEGIKIKRISLIQQYSKLSRQVTDIIKKEKIDSAYNYENLISENISEIAVEPLSTLANVPTAKDFILEDGDEIIIPQVKSTISITGEVQNPTSIQYVPGKSMGYYISSAGGFSAKARGTKSFIVNSNGRSKKSRKIIGLFRAYPEIKPGATIVVPPKIQKDNKFDIAKAGVLISAITALATTIAVIKGL
jgi:protein involved in polysaccharide export with SLBB domain